jgi:hypothetical protein
VTSAYEDQARAAEREAVRIHRRFLAHRRGDAANLSTDFAELEAADAWQEVLLLAVAGPAPTPCPHLTDAPRPNLVVGSRPGALLCPGCGLAEAAGLPTRDDPQWQCHACRQRWHQGFMARAVLHLGRTVALIDVCAPCARELRG